MARQKTKKFEENKTRFNIVEPGKPLFGKTKSYWNEKYFHNNNPITLELACGRGEYTVGMAEMFPERNCIGIDLKGDRLWKGSGIALEQGLSNAAFLRIQIQHIEEHFASNEVAEIWIMFPDPRPKDREEKLRLTTNRFLDCYKSVLAPDGWVKLKTDNSGFFDYTLEVLSTRNDIVDLQQTRDLYGSEFREECFDIRTRYELKFMSPTNPIKYLKFRFL